MNKINKLMCKKENLNLVHTLQVFSLPDGRTGVCSFVFVFWGVFLLAFWLFWHIYIKMSTTALLYYFHDHLFTMQGIYILIWIISLFWLYDFFYHFNFLQELFYLIEFICKSSSLFLRTKTNFKIFYNIDLFYIAIS